MNAHEAERDLSRQSRIAAELIAEIAPHDDETLAHDTIEGETTLLEAVERALDEADMANAIAAGLATMIETYATRKHLAEKRRDRLHAAILRAMGMAGLTTLRLPAATLTAKAVPPKPIIVDEAAIPADLWKPQPPKIDKAALNAAAKAGPVPGVEMTNGGETLQVRRK